MKEKAGVDKEKAESIELNLMDPNPNSSPKERENQGPEDQDSEFIYEVPAESQGQEIFNEAKFEQPEESATPEPTPTEPDIETKKFLERSTKDAIHPVESDDRGFLVRNFDAFILWIHSFSVLYCEAQG